MELFKLFGTIAVQNSDANSAIDETSDKASSFSEKLGSGIVKAMQWGTAIVGGATVAVGGLVKFAESSASSADRVDKLSQKIGISRTAFQELDFICSQSGTSVETLQMGIKSLTTAMDGAASGTATNVEQFNRLGVSVTDSSGKLRSQEEVMWETMTALQGMDNQTEKARLATELFGRSGTELMPLLNGASGSIEEMKQQAHELGLVLDDELIDNGVELTDSLDQTKRAFQSIITQLGGALMPIVTKVSDYIQKAMPTIQGLIERIGPVLTTMLDSMLPPLMDLVEQIFPILIGLIETLLPPLTNIIETLLPVITDLLTMIVIPLTQIVEMILPLLISLIEPLLPLLEPILGLLQPIIDVLLILLEPLVQLLNVILPPLITVITAIVNTIVAILQPCLEGIKTVIGGVVDFVKGAWEKITNFGETLKGGWQTVKEKAGDLKDGVVEKFSALKDKAGELWGNIKDKVSEKFSALKDKAVEIGGNIKDNISEKFNAVKDTMSNVMQSAKDVVSEKLSNMKQAFEENGGGIKGIASAAIEGVKGYFTAGFDFINNLTGGKLNAIKDKFSSIFDSVKNVVHNAIETIKSKFNFSWSLPKLKLPHPKITGKFSLNPPSVPKFSLEWYKEGGILTKPTIFDFNPATGKAKVGGEAGAEAVAPIDVLQGYVADAVASQNGGLIQVIEQMFSKLFDILEQYFPEFANLEVSIDSRKMATALAPQMDLAIGRIQSRKNRGYSHI